MLVGVFWTHIRRPTYPCVLIPAIDEDALALALDEVMPVTFGCDNVAAEFALDGSTH
jgi:hypothetical protein